MLLSVVAVAAGLLAASPAAAVLYPSDIQGAGFLSPYSGRVVQDVQGVVRSIVKNGYYIETPASKQDNDPRTSEGLFIFTSSKPPASIVVGDWISVGSGNVTEFGTNKLYFKQTELAAPKNVTIVQANAASEIKDLVIGLDRSPPTEYIGIEDVFAVPPAQKNIEQERATALQPEKYGADFWESLEGMTVTLKAPRAVARMTSYNEVQVVPSNINATGVNARGGLSITYKSNPNGNGLLWDVNPEAINVLTPTNGTNEKNVLIGDILQDITGVVNYAFGTIAIVPNAAIAVSQKVTGTAAPTTLVSNGTCNGLTFAGYNVENLDALETDRIAKLGSHIDEYLRDPAFLVLNEVQDNDGAINSGSSAANGTIAAIIDSIKGAAYDSANIDPVYNQGGGEPNSNIRPVFLWRSDMLKKWGNAEQGEPTEAVTVSNVDGVATLSKNPGLIDPTNSVWNNSRKPLVGQFCTTASCYRPVTVIGAHLTSKGGGDNLYGPPQPPTNGGETKRQAQAQVIRDFVNQIYAAQPNAKVIVIGDLNEFSGVEPLQTLVSPDTANNKPAALAEIVVKDPVERYSYVFQQNSQQIDHILITPSRKRLSVVEMIHLNTWGTEDEAVSDHDAIIMQTNVCQ